MSYDLVKVEETVNVTNKKLEESYIVKFIKLFGIIFLFISIIVILLSMIMNLFYYPIDFIIHRKYCDDYFVKCDYYETTGIITNNTIIENINLNNFVLSYNIESTYNYNTNNTCYLTNDYNTLSLYNAQIMATKTIGMVNNIYVSYKDNTKCVINCFSCLEIVKEWNITKLLNFLSFIIFIFLAIIYRLVKNLLNDQIKLVYKYLCYCSLLWFTTISCIFFGYSIIVADYKD